MAKYSVGDRVRILRRGRRRTVEILSIVNDVLDNGDPSTYEVGDITDVEGNMDSVILNESQMAMVTATPETRRKEEERAEIIRMYLDRGVTPTEQQINNVLITRRRVQEVSEITRARVGQVQATETATPNLTPEQGETRPIIVGTAGELNNAASLIDIFAMNRPFTQAVNPIGPETQTANPRQSIRDQIDAMFPNQQAGADIDVTAPVVTAGEMDRLIRDAQEVIARNNEPIPLLVDILPAERVYLRLLFSNDRTLRIPEGTAMPEPMRRLPLIDLRTPMNYIDARTRIWRSIHPLTGNLILKFLDQLVSFEISPGDTLSTEPMDQRSVRILYDTYAKWDAARGVSTLPVNINFGIPSGQIDTVNNNIRFDEGPRAYTIIDFETNRHIQISEGNKITIRQLSADRATRMRMQPLANTPNTSTNPYRVVRNSIINVVGNGGRMLEYIDEPLRRPAETIVTARRTNINTITGGAFTFEMPVPQQLVLTDPPQRADTVYHFDAGTITNILIDAPKGQFRYVRFVAPNGNVYMSQVPTGIEINLLHHRNEGNIVQRTGEEPIPLNTESGFLNHRMFVPQAEQGSERTFTDERRVRVTRRNQDFVNVKFIDSLAARAYIISIPTNQDVDVFDFIAPNSIVESWYSPLPERYIDVALARTVRIADNNAAGVTAQHYTLQTADHNRFAFEICTTRDYNNLGRENRVVIDTLRPVMDSSDNNRLIFVDSKNNVWVNQHGVSLANNLYTHSDGAAQRWIIKSEYDRVRNGTRTVGIPAFGHTVSSGRVRPSSKKLFRKRALPELKDPKHYASKEYIC